MSGLQPQVPVLEPKETASLRTAATQRIAGTSWKGIFSYVSPPAMVFEVSVFFERLVTPLYIKSENCPVKIQNLTEEHLIYFYVLGDYCTDA
jgi:hypothetical protein